MVAIRRDRRSLAARDFLVFEATSGCDRLLRAACGKSEVAFARINPLHGWHYSQSLNLAKTDRLDARMLARFGAERHPPATPPEERARVELGQLNQRRDQLRRMITQEKNCLRACVLDLVKRAITASLRSLAAQVSAIATAIAAHLRAHPVLAAAAALLQSIPGVGVVTASELLAYLPELGQIDRRAIASLGGLAPKARESGKFKGKRQLGPGRRHVRKALYMAAKRALRHKSDFTPFIERMFAKHKAGKVTIIAIARKILTIANAILRSGEPYKTPT